MSILCYISCYKSLISIYLIVVRYVDTVSSALIAMYVDFSHDFLAHRLPIQITGLTAEAPVIEDSV